MVAIALFTKLSLSYIVVVYVSGIENRNLERGSTVNIVVLHASPRKGNTDAIIERVKHCLVGKEPMVFHDVYLPRDAPVFCHGCYSCFERGENTCPNAKFIQPIAKKIEASDGMIIATPIYVMQIPGALKSFLDHMAYRFLNHRPAFFGKKAFIITNTAGAGNANAIKYLKQNLSFWGINNVTTLAITLQAASLDEMESSRQKKTLEEMKHKCAAFQKELSQQDTKQHSSFLSVILFHIGRSIILTLPQEHADRQYWTQKGWLDLRKKHYHDEKPPWYQTLAGKMAARVAFK